MQGMQKKRSCNCCSNPIDRERMKYTAPTLLDREVQMRLSILCCAAAFFVACLNCSVDAQIGANVTYTSSQLGANSYQYTFTLHNTGTTNIGTFWLGWTPASLTFYPYDLLPSIPTIDSSASGWGGLNIHDSPFGVDSVEWYDFGTALSPGNTLTGFTITTVDSPATMASLSTLPGSYPVTTSWVYVGAAQNGSNLSDQGALVSPTAVPEPVIGLIAPVMIVGMIRRRRKSYAR
jgi:hypothetical protein